MNEIEMNEINRSSSGSDSSSSDSDSDSDSSSDSGSDSGSNSGSDSSGKKKVTFTKQLPARLCSIGENANNMNEKIYIDIMNEYLNKNNNSKIPPKFCNKHPIYKFPRYINQNNEPMFCCRDTVPTNNEIYTYIHERLVQLEEEEFNLETIGIDDLLSHYYQIFNLKNILLRYSSRSDVKTKTYINEATNNINKTMFKFFCDKNRNKITMFDLTNDIDYYFKMIDDDDLIKFLCVSTIYYNTMMMKYKEDKDKMIIKINRYYTTLYSIKIKFKENIIFIKDKNINLDFLNDFLNNIYLKNNDEEKKEEEKTKIKKHLEKVLNKVIQQVFPGKLNPVQVNPVQVNEEDEEEEEEYNDTTTKTNTQYNGQKEETRGGTRRVIGRRRTRGIGRRTRVIGRRTSVIGRTRGTARRRGHFKK
jgi:hypothetical protein